MLARARRVFTQPHLSVHMFFHTFHIDSLNAAWPRIFGVDVTRTYQEMRRGGLCYLDVGVRHRGSATAVRRSLRAALAASERRGVRGGETLPAIAREVLAGRLSQADGWLTYRTGR